MQKLFLKEIILKEDGSQGPHKKNSLVSINLYRVGDMIVFVQVAPTSSKQHGVNVGVNASATPFQQASGYGSHGYSTGEALNRVETACLGGSCRSCSLYLHSN